MSDLLGKAAMADDASRSRLGRGLAALIGEVSAEASSERPRGQRRLPTGALRPNARNPRRVFSNTELDELVASLRERGIIQPIVARPVRGASDSYEIIAGERRWRAAQRAGLHEVPVVIIEATDAEALQIAIIENVQRADLNPLEEADGYRALMDEFHNNQEDIAKIIGKSRSHVANTLRLLKLPETVKAHIQFRKTVRRSCAHADRSAQCRAARGGDRCTRSQCASGRSAGARGRTEAGKGNGRQLHARAEKNADLVALEKRLADSLGLVVSIDDGARGGTLTIRYRNHDQLDEVLRRLERKH